MAIGTSAQLSDMIGQDADCTINAENHNFYFTDDVTTWEMKTALVGSKECVALVQAAAGTPQTSLWRKGPKVKGNANIVLGTAIATFDEEGLYPNHAEGNHAALFVSLASDGIVVVDQWRNKTPAKPSRRTIRFRNGSGSASNDGDRFWVIVTEKQ